MSTHARDAETFSPADDRTATIVSFVEALRARGMDAPEATAKLVARDGSQIELPDEIFDALQFVAEALAANQAVTIAPRDKQMTTQEAADFLGCSRPTLIKLVERGEIPYTKIGRHRRITLASLIDYQHRQAEVRSGALDLMAEVAAESDLYEKTARPPIGIR